MAVDVGHRERSARIAQADERTGHQRAAAAEEQRAAAVRRDLAHGGAHRLGRLQDAVDADDAGRRIAVFAADAHVEVAAVLGAEAGQQPAVADGRRRVLGAAGPPDGVDRHAHGDPASRHGPMLAADDLQLMRHGGVVLMGTRGLCTAELGVRFPPPPSLGRASRSSVHGALAGLKTAL
jgi:hypothetical protein